MSAPSIIYGTGGVRVIVEGPLLSVLGGREVTLPDDARVDLARALLPEGYAIADEVDLL